jgi:hypothetical protein
MQDPENQCCGSGMFIPDLTFFHPGSELSPSQIAGPHQRKLSILTPQKTKKWFLSSRKYDPGCSSLIPDPDADFLPIPDPGSRGQKGTGSRIRIRNSAENTKSSLWLEALELPSVYKLVCRIIVACLS